MSLSDTVLKATSSDPNVRVPAEKMLKQMEASNLPEYLCGLCMELGDNKKNPGSRRLAGIILKNTLVAKEESSRFKLARRWLNLAGDVRTRVKQMLCHILKDPEKNVRSTAALVIGQIARVEIPESMWDDLVPMLVQNITTNQGGDALRHSSFEALGYVCEECPTALQAQSNNVLRAIHNGMRKEEQNMDIKFAATKALENALEFVKGNMENPNDRKMIMDMVYGVTQCNEVRVRAAAYQCLIQIAGLYYQFLRESIAVIFELTKHAMQHENEEVTPCAIEIWSTICEEEIERIEEAEEAQSNNEAPAHPCQKFIESAQAQLVPQLMICLTKQSEDVDDDTFDSATAAGSCIELIATTTKDLVVPIAMPFITQHIRSQDWRHREASILAFGAILDGPSPQVLSPMVSQAFPILLNSMKDPMPLIKDTSAWTIGRVCSFVPETINDEVLEHLMLTLVNALQDVPKVASASAWAIHNLAEVMQVGDNDQTTPLSRYFEGLVRSLLQTSARPDASEANLMATAYETINVLIMKAAKDRHELIAFLMPPMMERLRETVMATNLAGTDKDRRDEVQGLLCSVMNTIITKLGGVDPNTILPFADNLMVCFLKVLGTNQASVHEEALMAIGAIAGCVGADFEKYMQTLNPYLIVGLRNADEFHVCVDATVVVSEIAAALGQRLFPYADDLMLLLLKNLNSGDIERVVKPHLITCMGDVAMSLGPLFDRYFRHVMEMMVSASSIQLDTSDYENAEYLVQLRDAVLFCYTSILQGLGPEKIGMFMNFMKPVVEFIDVIANEQDKEPLLKNAVGVIGDMASKLGKQVAQFLNRPSVLNLINEASASKDETVRQSAEFAKSEMNRIVG